MINAEFQTKLKEAFNIHTFMNKRDRHTINELLYVLRSHNEFCAKDYNISICKKNGEWWSIPTLDAFVSISILSVWFADSDFGKFGKTDKKCPRCGGNIICEEKGSSYRIRCESSECIFADIRGI